MYRNHERKDMLTEGQKKHFLKSKDKTEQITMQPRLQKLLSDAAIECIIRDARPFNDFEKEGMRYFLEKAIPVFKPPGRHNVAKILKYKYKRFFKQLKKLLAKPSHIALTADLWLNRRMIHFLAITAHFLDSKFQPHSIRISFKRFSKQHLAKNIKEFIIKELDKLGISTKIVSITTDCGADIKSATSGSEFGFRTDCLAHDLNNVVKNSLNLFK